jgi:SAM-dependent methyltransferase
VAFPGTSKYWERRYAKGGSSGPGSRGQLAAFKAAVINGFIRENGIESVVEFGCGDGGQLALADYPRYVGLDVSKTAILRCKQRFGGDPTKSFFLYDPEYFVDNQGVFAGDLTLSVDVIFHLVEDRMFQSHMSHLFSCAKRFVIIYSKDTDEPATVGYVRNRRFSPWVEERMPQWRLVRTIPNDHPWRGDVQTGSRCDFFIYARDHVETEPNRMP